MRDWSSNKVREFLGISKWALYRLIKSGRLRPTKQARRWHFNPVMIKAYRELKRLPACQSPPAKELVRRTGLGAGRPRGRVFVADAVLNKYFGAYPKYQIIRKPGSIYWLKIRGERAKIKFCIRRLHSFGRGIRLVIIEPKYFARLPATHQRQWIDNEFIL